MRDPSTSLCSETCRNINANCICCRTVAVAVSLLQVKKFIKYELCEVKLERLDRRVLYTAQYVSRYRRTQVDFELNLKEIDSVICLKTTHNI